MVESPTAEVTELEDQSLMVQIYGRWARLIESVCQRSSIPPSFLAGLIANESGGDAHAEQFEPAIWANLHVLKTAKVRGGSSLPGVELEQLPESELRLLSTSFGLAQIMGYEAQDEGYAPLRLFDPEFNIMFALRLLANICEHCWLDPQADFEFLLRCWTLRGLRENVSNPKLVDDGIRRMETYKRLTVENGNGSQVASLYRFAFVVSERP